MSSSDYHAQIPKPRFSLSSVRKSNPHLAMDSNWAFYQQRITVHRKAPTTPQCSSPSDPSTPSSRITASMESLSALDELLRGLGIDMSTPAGMEELIRRLAVGRSFDPPDSSSDSDDGNFRAVTNAAPLGGFKGAVDVRKPSPSLDGTLKEEEGEIVWEDSLSINALTDILDKINTTLDAMDERTPILIEPMDPVNPYMESCGTVWIQCQPFSPSCPSEATFFKIHRVLLWINCRHSGHRFSNSIYALDTDKRTVGIVVEWLYHRSLSHLSGYPTAQLLKLIIVCLALGIPKLFNTLVPILMHRHGNPRPHVFSNTESSTCIPNSRFEPETGLLRRIYQFSRQGDPVRSVVGYLLARAGVENFGLGVGWELEVERSVRDFLEMVRVDERGWKAVDERMFLMEEGVRVR